LTGLTKVLNDQTPNAILQEVMWTLSNIAAGGDDHIRAILQCEDLLQKVLILLCSNSPMVQREASYVITNIITTTEDRNVI